MLIIDVFTLVRKKDALCVHICKSYTEKLFVEVQLLVLQLFFALVVEVIVVGLVVQKALKIPKIFQYRK